MSETAVVIYSFIAWTLVPISLMGLFWYAMVWLGENWK